jgi:putative acetyltransferase
MTAPVTFQRATNAHLAVVQRLVDDALREYGLRVLLDSSDIDLTDIEKHYDARGGALELLLEAGEQLIGVMGWRPGLDGAGKPVCELKKLYLAASARGRGVGRLALERLLAHARAAGCVAITLETAAVLAEANRLYVRFGFVQVVGTAAGSFATLSEQCDLAYRLALDPVVPA